MLFRHSAIYVASNLITGLFGLATAIVLTRVLTPADYGVYGLGIAIALFTSSAVFDWHGTSYLRFVQSQREREETMPTFLALFGALSAGVAISFVIVYAARLAPAYHHVLFLGSVAGIATAWFQFSTRVQIAALEPARALSMNLTRGVIAFVLSLAVALATESAIWVLVATAAAQVVGASMYKLPGLLKNVVKVHGNVVREVLRFGYPLAISAVSAGLGTIISRFMLDQLASTEAVGRFTAATAVVQNSLNMIAAGVGTASYQLVLKAIERGNPDDIELQLRQNFALLLSLLLPAAVGLVMLSPSLMPLLLGRDFVGATIDLSPWLAAVAVVGGLRFYYLDFAFQFGGKTGLLAITHSMVAIFTVLLNFLLIPLWAERGAAIAQLVALAPSLLLVRLLSGRIFQLPFPLKPLGQVIFASGLMAATLALLPADGIAGLLVQIAAGGAVYAAVLFALDFMSLRRSFAKWFIAVCELPGVKLGASARPRARTPGD